MLDPKNQHLDLKDTLIHKILDANPENIDAFILPMISILIEESTPEQRKLFEDLQRQFSSLKRDLILDVVQDAQNLDKALEEASVTRLKTPLDKAVDVQKVYLPFKQKVVTYIQKIPADDLKPVLLNLKPMLDPKNQHLDLKNALINKILNPETFDDFIVPTIKILIEKSTPEQRKFLEELQMEFASIKRDLTKEDKAVDKTTAKFKPQRTFELEESSVSPLAPLKAQRNLLREKLRDIFCPPSSLSEISYTQYQKTAQELQKTGQLSAPSKQDKFEIQNIVDDSKIHERLDHLESLLKKVSIPIPPTLQELRNVLKNPVVYLSDISAFISTLEEAVVFSNNFEELVTEHEKLVNTFRNKLEKLLPLMPQTMHNSFQKLINLMKDPDLTFEDLKYIQSLNPQLFQNLNSQDADELHILFEQILRGKDLSHGHIEIEASLDQIRGSSNEIDRNLKSLYEQSPGLEKFRSQFEEKITEHFLERTQRPKEGFHFWDMLELLPLEMKSELFELQKEGRTQDIPLDIRKRIGQIFQDKNILFLPKEQNAFQRILNDTQDKEGHNLNDQLETLSSKVEVFFHPHAVSNSINIEIMKIKEALEDPLFNYQKIEEMVIALKTLILHEEYDLPKPKKELEKFLLEVTTMAKRIDIKFKALYAQAEFSAYRSEFQTKLKEIFQTAQEPQSFDLNAARQIQSRIAKAKAYVKKAEDDAKQIRGFGTKYENLDKAWKLIEAAPLPQATKDYFRARVDHPAGDESLLKDMAAAIQPSFMGLHRTLFEKFGRNLDNLTKQKVQDIAKEERIKTDTPTAV